MDLCVKFRSSAIIKTHQVYSVRSRVRTHTHGDILQKVCI